MKHPVCKYVIWTPLCFSRQDGSEDIHFELYRPIGTDYTSILFGIWHELVIWPLMTQG